MRGLTSIDQRIMQLEGLDTVRIKVAKEGEVGRAIGIDPEGNRSLLGIREGHRALRISKHLELSRRSLRQLQSRMVSWPLHVDASTVAIDGEAENPTICHAHRATTMVTEPASILRPFELSGV